MHQVISTARLSPNVTRLDVLAPRIAQVRQPGQFVIVHLGDRAERIPLTIADADLTAGTIALVIQSVGKSTRDLVALEPGQIIEGIAGPLGRPTELISSGKAICIGGGVGTAVVHPIAQGLHRNGATVLSIIGGRSREWVIFESELRRLGDALAASHWDVVYAVGPVPMMRAVVNLTKPLGVHTVVSLNPIMVDGTGMCGGCRVGVGGQTLFACVDGPEFDGHLVDFDLLMDRLSTYREFEQKAVSDCENHTCRIGLTAPAVAKESP
jgi:ferredoxin/flavodoxin---NADP+ reductase